MVAALALYLGGKAEEAFDWNHRPFFLRFVDENRSVQIDAYKELCARLASHRKYPQNDFHFGNPEAASRIPIRQRHATCRRRAPQRRR